jgi:Flp pilus assembly protein TadG
MIDQLERFRAKMWRRARRSVLELAMDRRGVAAIEFAMIVPIMLVLFFGTVEFSSGVAVDRKVTLTARTLSDLTSQFLASPATMADSDLINIFTASTSILYPYTPVPTKAQLSEIYVDSNKIAKIQWSKAGVLSSSSSAATLTTSTRSAGDTVTSVVPTALLVPQTYLIFSEVSYLYTPTIGYVMAKTGVNLTDTEFTRPRQGTCVLYNNVPSGCPLT